MRHPKLVGVRQQSVPDPPLGGAPRPAVPDDRRLALYGRHPHPPPLASSALHRGRRRLRRRHRLGVGGHPGGGRGGLRPDRRVRVHQLRRLRVHGEPARPSPPPQHHLPQRARAAVRGELHRDGRRRHPAGVLVGDRRDVSQCRHRLRRRHHSAQLEPERRQAVARSRRRRRGAPPPDARAARRAAPDQGQLGVPLRPPGARRGRDGGRAVHVRAGEGGGPAARRGAAPDRPLPAPQHGP